MFYFLKPEDQQKLAFCDEIQLSPLIDSFVRSHQSDVKVQLDRDLLTLMSKAKTPGSTAFLYELNLEVYTKALSDIMKVRLVDSFLDSAKAFGSVTALATTFRVANRMVNSPNSAAYVKLLNCGLALISRNIEKSFELFN